MQMVYAARAHMANVIAPARTGNNPSRLPQPIYTSPQQLEWNPHAEHTEPTPGVNPPAGDSMPTSGPNETATTDDTKQGNAQWHKKCTAGSELCSSPRSNASV